MRPPAFWAAGLDPRSREAAPLTRALLTPAARLYAWAGRRKIAHAQPVEVEAPVICVGNLTLGGAGKTPVAAAIRSRLMSSGRRAATLSRGYSGRLNGPIRVDAEQHSAPEVGDEALMLARSGEAWIGRDRVTAAVEMATAGVGAIILDDGHQNPALQKSLSLVVIDSDAPFGNGFVFPKGPLREPVGFGLSRADAVILMGGGPEPSALEGFKGLVLRARLHATTTTPDGPLVAFAGIGRPEKFFETLESIGAQIVDAAPFPDHHRYTPSDLKYLTSLAADRNARLITTEKDFVRLPAEIAADVLTLPVEARFEDPVALEDLLAQHLAP